MVSRSIEAHVGSGKVVSVHGVWGHPYDGYLLGVGEEWCLLQAVWDFTPDGYICLRTGDIEGVGKFSAFMNKIHRREGVVPDAKPPRVDLDSTRKLMADVDARGKLFMVDFDYDAEPSLYLGRVHRLRAKGMTFWKMDTLGKWQSEPAEIKYEDISVVRFGTRYDGMFEKYAPSPTPPGA